MGVMLQCEQVTPTCLSSLMPCAGGAVNPAFLISVFSSSKDPKSSRHIGHLILPFSEVLSWCSAHTRIHLIWILFPQPNLVTSCHNITLHFLSSISPGLHWILLYTICNSNNAFLLHCYVNWLCLSYFLFQTFKL